MQWKYVVLVGVLGIIFVIVVLPRTCSSDFTPSPLSQFKDREWTARELAYCNQFTGDEREACDEAEFDSVLDTLDAKNKLSDELQREYSRLDDYLFRIRRSFNDMFTDNVVDRSEYDFMCSVVGQWENQVIEARNWVEAREGKEWLGMEKRVVIGEDTVRAIMTDCGYVSKIPAPTSTPTPTSTPFW